MPEQTYTDKLGRKLTVRYVGAPPSNQDLTELFEVKYGKPTPKQQLVRPAAPRPSTPQDDLNDPEIREYIGKYLTGEPRNAKSQPFLKLSAMLNAPESQWPGMLRGWSPVGQRALPLAARLQRQQNSEEWSALGKRATQEYNERQINPGDSFLITMGKALSLGYGGAPGVGVFTPAGAEIGTQRLDRIPQAMRTGLPINQVESSSIINPVAERSMMRQEGFLAKAGALGLGMSRPSNLALLALDAVTPGGGTAPVEIFGKTLQFGGKSLILPRPNPVLGKMLAPTFIAQGAVGAVEDAKKGDWGAALADSGMMVVPMAFHAGIEGVKGKIYSKGIAAHPVEPLAGAHPSTNPTAHATIAEVQAHTQAAEQMGVKAESLTAQAGTAVRGAQRARVNAEKARAAGDITKATQHEAKAAQLSEKAAKLTGEANTAHTERQTLLGKIQELQLSLARQEGLAPQETAEPPTTNPPLRAPTLPVEGQEAAQNSGGFTDKDGKFWAQDAPATRIGIHDFGSFRQALRDSFPSLTDQQIHHTSLITESLVRAAARLSGLSTTEIYQKHLAGITKGTEALAREFADDFNRRNGLTGEKAALPKEFHGATEFARNWEIAPETGNARPRLEPMTPDDARSVIGSLLSYNASTPPHEIVHGLLSEFLQKYGGHQELAKIEKWCGVKDGVWTTEAQEKLARAYEKYLRDGEAFHPSLTTTFAKFRVWIKNVYETSFNGRTLDGLKKFEEFPPEVVEILRGFHDDISDIVQGQNNGTKRGTSLANFDSVGVDPNRPGTTQPPPGQPAGGHNPTVIGRGPTTTGGDLSLVGGDNGGSARRASVSGESPIAAGTLRLENGRGQASTSSAITPGTDSPTTQEGNARGTNPPGVPTNQSEQPVSASLAGRKRVSATIDGKQQAFDLDAHHATLWDSERARYKAEQEQIKRTGSAEGRPVRMQSAARKHAKAKQKIVNSQIKQKASPYEIEAETPQAEQLARSLAASGFDAFPLLDKADTTPQNTPGKRLPLFQRQVREEPGASPGDPFIITGVDDASHLQVGDRLRIPAYGDGNVVYISPQNIGWESDSGIARSIPTETLPYMVPGQHEPPPQSLDQFIRGKLAKMYDYAQNNRGSNNAQKNIVIPLRAVTPQEAARILQDTGVDVSGYYFVADSSLANHAVKQHGGGSRTFGQGQRAITRQDFIDLVDVLTNPDITKRETSVNQMDRIGFIKRLTDDHLYIAEVRKGKRVVTGVTMWKYPQGLGNLGLAVPPPSATGTSAVPGVSRTSAAGTSAVPTSNASVVTNPTTSIPPPGPTHNASTPPTTNINSSLLDTSILGEHLPLFQRRSASEEFVPPEIPSLGRRAGLDITPRDRSVSLDHIVYGKGQPEGSGKWNVNQIADHFTEEAKKVWGDNGARNLNDPDTRKRVVDLLTHESELALTKSSNALGWYDEKLSRAHATVSLLHPEIAHNENARFAFDAALAITSNGMSVPENATLALRVYEAFKENLAGGSKRPMPEDMHFPGTTADAMKEAFTQYNDLYEELGAEALRKFANTMFTVKELRAYGFNINGEQSNTQVPGSVIFGPKIGGGFLRNLQGHYDALTMDRWFMRTWGRLTGTMYDVNPALVEKQMTRLRDAVKNVDDDTISGFGSFRRASLLTNPTELERFAGEVYRRYSKGGFKDKTELNNAAKQLIVSRDPIIAPRNGAERKAIREIAKEVQARLKSRGIPIELSDWQALIWYPEKELYKKLGSGDARSEPTDYEQEYRKIAKARGVDDESINRSHAGLSSVGRVGGRGGTGFPEQPTASDSAGASSIGAKYKSIGYEKGTGVPATVTDAIKQINGSQTKDSGGQGVLPLFQRHRGLGFRMPAEKPEIAGGSNNPYSASSYGVVRHAQLDADPNIKSWTRNFARIPYRDPETGKERTYNPDFKINMTDGRVIIEEIKPSLFISRQEVQAKTEAAKAYYGDHAEYRFISAQQLGQSQINKTRDAFDKKIGKPNFQRRVNGASAPINPNATRIDYRMTPTLTKRDR